MFKSSSSSENIVTGIVSEIIESAETRITGKSGMSTTVLDATNISENLLLNESINSLDDPLLTDDLGEPTTNNQLDNLN